MQSVTKTMISREDIYVLTQKAFPNCAIKEVRELCEGMFNTAYYVTGDGELSEGIVLKIGPREGTKLLTYEKDILKTEVAVCKMLEATDVPAPKVLYADYTRTLLPFDYFFMTYIPGVLWKNADKQKLERSRKRLMRELGHYYAEIHSIVGTHFGYIKDDLRFQFDSWSKAFACMMQDVCNDGIKDGLLLPYDEIMSVVFGYEACLDEVTSPQLVDFDLWAGNAILKEDGDQYTISGIIDFERCFFGDPNAEFIAAIGIYDQVGEEADLIEGYGQPMVLDENTRIRMNLYRLYLTVIMYVETYRYEAEYAETVKTRLKKSISALLEQL